MNLNGVYGVDLHYLVNQGVLQALFSEIVFYDVAVEIATLLIPNNIDASFDLDLFKKGVWSDDPR